MARERRPTLYFLKEIRSFSPVFLDTEVDMTSIMWHRDARQKYSIVTYVLSTAAHVLIRHPEANAAMTGRLRPRVARFGTVNGKFTLDRTVNRQRVVLSTVLTGLESATLGSIQSQINHFRNGDAESMPEFAGARMLARLPLSVGGPLFRFWARPLSRRATSFGTLAVTSLGHRAVDGFYSVGGTTITLGVGRIVERPVVRAGEIVIAPVMRLSLTFDHRVIDGAEAADVLQDIKDALENFEGKD